jgi:transposase
MPRADYAELLVKVLDEMDFPGPYGARVESLRDLLEIYDRGLAMVERRLHLELEDHRGDRAIQAIYGVGEITAAIFVAEIADVTRFPHRPAPVLMGGHDPQAARVGHPLL